MTVLRSFLPRALQVGGSRMGVSAYPAPDALRLCRFGVCCALAVLTVVSAAHAADTTDPDRAIAEFLDPDGDHRISYEEFVESVATKAVREMDANKDGSLSQPEVAATNINGAASFPAIDFHKADADHDGKLSLEELKQAIGANADVEALFHALDKDGDGLLSESELGAIHSVPLVRLPF